MASFLFEQSNVKTRHLIILQLKTNSRLLSLDRNEFTTPNDDQSASKTIGSFAGAENCVVWSARVGNVLFVHEIESHRYVGIEQTNKTEFTQTNKHI